MFDDDGTPGTRPTALAADRPFSGLAQPLVHHRSPRATQGAVERVTPAMSPMRAAVLVSVLIVRSVLSAQPCAVLPTCVVNSGLEAEPGNDMNIGEPYDVEGWSVTHGNPTIFANDAPTDDSGSSIWMWSYSGQGEGISTCFDLRAGVTYEVCLWVRNTNAVALDGRLQIWMVDEVSPAADNPFVLSPSALDGELVDSSWVNGSEWTQLTALVTPMSDRSRLLIFPHMASPPENGVSQYELQVDDVRISPVVAASNLSLAIDATQDRIGWCDSTTLCVSGLPSNVPVAWSPVTGLSSLVEACATASPCATTTYTATISIPATCPNSCSPTVQVEPLSITIEVLAPTFQVSALGPLICGTEQVVVASVPEGICATGAGWRATPGTTVRGDSLIIAELSAENVGPYSYGIVHPSGGCTAEGATVLLQPEGTVAELYVPNAFSPDGDGINDVFTGISRGFDRFDLTIYDRWGRVLHATQDQDLGWDGTSNGQPMPSGVYAYVLEHTLACSAKDERVVGHVTLLR